MKNGNECRHNINVPYVKRNGHVAKCLVADSPITRCKEKPKKNCNIEKFFSKEAIKNNLEMLKIAVERKKFSLRFNNKRKNKKWLECFKKWDFTKNEFDLIGDIKRGHSTHDKFGYIPDSNQSYRIKGFLLDFLVFLI